jgi:two-component system, NtrC family, sensor kinase
VNTFVASAEPTPSSAGERRSPSVAPLDRRTTSQSYRILVVDDNPSIHDDFRRIFATERPRGGELDDLAASVFGLPQAPTGPQFSLDHASQGQAALARVIAAREANAPYALLFMDVRMPPGWDGVEAAARVLADDPDVHVVLCTAYPEQRWRHRVEQLSGRDRVLVLKKPFDVVEVQQLACALCEKWVHAQEHRARVHHLERSVTTQQGQLAAAADHLRQEIASRALIESRLRKAERLEGLGRLAAGLCHEINNPLSYIVTSSELMGEELAELGDRVPHATQQELAQLVNAISLGASRITRLVRNIRMFARHSDAEPEIVELDQAIETAVSMVQPQLLPHVEIAIDTSQAVPVLGRRFELEQVLINLVENALHAMAEQKHPVPRVTIVAELVGGEQVAIEVADTGPGIDEAIIEQIFDPFFTTKPVNKGTGLGLSICHTLIADMGGSIDARNRHERGAAFIVTLPVAQPVRPAVAPAAPSAVETIACRRGRVLVVDDEPLMLTMLERVLHPHEVTCCQNARMALELCCREPFDVILCDVMMPGINGWEFHHMLAELRPGMEERVVFITGGALLDDVRELLASVPNRTFEKPFDSRELRAFVAEQIDRLVVLPSRSRS